MGEVNTFASRACQSHLPLSLRERASPASTTIRCRERLAQRVLSPADRTPHPAAFGCHLLPQGEKGRHGRGEHLRIARMPVASPSPLAGEGITGINYKFAAVGGWLSGH